MRKPTLLARPEVAKERAKDLDSACGVRGGGRERRFGCWVQVFIRF